MRRTVCLCLFFFLLCSAAFADLPGWDTVAQGKYTTCLTVDMQGRVWVGTEAQGVWMASPAEPEKGWTHYGLKDGLAEDAVTALGCDSSGHVWVGHRSRGVSVFSGQVWKNYDAASGPLGSHVFALAVSPKDGDVWMATEAGLARYSLSKASWRYYTRADGLPADQVRALAFDPKGTLYAGTQCDGLVIGSAADEYASWQHLIGPTRPSPFPSGSGFPDCRINALLAARDGSVYAGTPSGLAGSQDGGKSWNYLRGTNWLAKVQGQSGTVPADLAPSENPTLAEDDVTALAEDSAGRLWIGHSVRSVEVVDPANAGRAPVQVFPDPKADDIHSLLASGGPSVLIGGYGSGLSAAPTTDPNAPALPVRPAPLSQPLPSPAAAPTVAELKALLAAIPTAAPALRPGDGVFLGDDWQTQGDWVGRYGQQYAELCGINSPYPGTEVQQAGYDADEQVGPHHKDDASVYSYIANLNTTDRRLPFCPALGHRREAEVNDGSWDAGKYPAAYDGPDLWVTFTVPAGTHRASFYFVNNDGHDGPNRRRNYLLELKADKPTLAAEDQEAALASAWVADFYGGVYKQFLVQGPGTFHLKIGRCYSACTKIQGIFLDKLSDASASDARAAPPTGPSSLPSLTGRPYIGLVNVALVNPDHAAHSKYVLRVVAVLPGSPAAEAGIHPGDILLFAGQTPLPNPESLSDILTNFMPDAELPLTVRRGPKTLKISVTPRPGPVGHRMYAVQPLPSAFAAYAPPAVPLSAPKEADTLTAARALWSALEAAQGRSGSETVQTRGRVLAYRAALAAQAPDALLANWRWHLSLWSQADHADFDRAMSEAQKTQSVLTPPAAK